MFDEERGLKWYFPAWLVDTSCVGGLSPIGVMGMVDVAAGGAGAGGRLSIWDGRVGGEIGSGGIGPGGSSVGLARGGGLIGVLVGVTSLTGLLFRG